MTIEYRYVLVDKQTGREFHEIFVDWTFSRQRTMLFLENYKRKYARLHNVRPDSIEWKDI